MKVALLLFALVAAVSLASAATAQRSSLTDREAALFCVAAIKSVGMRPEHAGSRPKIFVLSQQLLPHVAKSDRDRFTIVGDAPPFRFPSQKSSDTGPIYLRVGTIEASVDGERADVRIGFYMGPEAAVAWKIRFRKYGGEWQIIGAEIIGVA